MFQKKLILLLTLSITTSYTLAATDKLVCFFASWAVYRNGLGTFQPENIDAERCTHVYYAFLGTNTDGTIKILDPWCDINLGGLTKVSALKKTNPELKTLITIGGYNAGNTVLNSIAASSTLRQTFIRSTLEFLTQYGYDGLDIDWMYPQASDKANFVTLLQELRTAFDDNGGLILSVTATANPLASYDIPAITKVADLINLMTYDYNGPYDGVTGLISPLTGSYSVENSVELWITGGADAAKLTFSVPFYGHSYTLSDPNSHGIGAPATVGISGPYTQSPGTLGFNEICELYDDWERVWDSQYQVPYKYSGTNWVSYEDEESIAIKVKFAKVQGLAGISVWSVDTDDFRGTCGTQHALLKVIKDNF